MNKAEYIAEFFGEPLTDDEIRRIGELRREGLGYRRIGKVIKRSPYTVRDVIRGRLKRYRELSGIHD